MTADAPTPAPPPRGSWIDRLKRTLRRRVEAGYEVRGECNLCGECCHTIWLCQGMKTIDEPLEISCETCGEGFHTQVQRVTCPYLSGEKTCSLFTPEKGLPYNCCRHFPRVKDILWHPGFYEELPDCDFYLAPRRLGIARRALHLLVLPCLWYFRLGRGRRDAPKTCGPNVVAPPDPRRPPPRGAPPPSRCEGRGERSTP